MKKNSFKNRLYAAGMLMLAATLLSANLQAATYYVTPTGAGVKNGKSWENAYDNIKSAVDAAEADATDEIWVKQGLYKLSATLLWKSGVNVYGGFAGTETSRDQRNLDAKLTVLDGDSVSRTAVLQGNHFATQTTWSGFTVQRGRSPYYGGVYMYRNMVIDHFIIKDCINEGTGTYGGGGVYISITNTSNDSIIIRNSKIVGNRAKGYGGGIAIGSSSPASSTYAVRINILIENTEIINNQAATRGGGIVVEPVAGSTKNIVIRNCVIANNSSGKAGGGISAYRVNLQVTNTTFANNVAGDGGGGGIYANSVDSLAITNSIFWNNEDTQNGVGSHSILSQEKGTVDSVVAIKNCAFGPALQVGTDVADNAALTAENNIALETVNTGSEVGKYYVNFKSPSAAAGYEAGDAGRINADWSLAAGSAAIDAGAAANVNYDIVDRSRPVGSGYDVGAYEYAEPVVIAAGAEVSADYTAVHGDVIFEAGTGSAGQWTASTPVTNGAIQLVKTFETGKTYAIGFPFTVASVSVTGYELKSYSGESNMFATAYTIEAGKGYLIKLPASLGASVTVTFTSVRNPTLAATPTLGANEYALVPNATLQNAASISGAENYYLFNSETGAFGAATAYLGGELKPFEAVLVTTTTGNLLLTPADIGAGNDATPSVTLTADSGISIVTPQGITYPYKTIEPFVATFKVAAGYTNVRAIVTANDASKSDTVPLTIGGDNIYTAAFSSIAALTTIRLAVDTIRSTVTINPGEGIGDVSLTSGTKVGYFDNAWFTFKTLDGYHTPKVAVGSAYGEVRKGANGVDTVFLGTVASNITVNIAVFRDNTAPVLYDIQTGNIAGSAIIDSIVNVTGNIQLRKSPAGQQPYAYLKFDVADAVKASNFDRVTLKLLLSGTMVQSPVKLLLQWVSNNSNGGDENTDGATPWDNGFTYDGRPIVLKDTMSIANVGSGPGAIPANTPVEFIIDDPAIIAQLKSAIAGDSKQLSFRVNPNTDNSIVSILMLYSAEGATDDIIGRTPKLIFGAREYPIAVVNEASDIITLTSPSAADTTYTVKHDSSFVLSFKVKKGYEPAVEGNGTLTGAPSITEDATYTFRMDKVGANSTIRLSADVIRFNVAVQTPNGHITVVEPAGGSSPYRVANDSSFSLSFRVDAGYILTTTVSNNPAYTLGDSAPDGSYAILLPKVTSDVTITIAADLPADSVTVSVAKPNVVTVTSPTLAGGVACKVARDSSFTLTFTVAEGYDVLVEVNGVEKDEWLAYSEGTYTFTVPQVSASIYLSIEAAIRQHNIVLIAEGVTITAPTDENPHVVNHGGSLTVHVTLASDYFAPIVLTRGDGSVINFNLSGGEYEATVSYITADDSIRITADNGVRYITIRKDERVTLLTSGGQPSTDTVREARVGQQFTVEFTVPAGYEPQVSLLGGGVGGVTTLGTGKANTYSSRISSVTANATIVIALPAATGVAEVDPNDPVVATQYYTLQGQEVRTPAVTGIYIVRRQHLSSRISVVKRLIAGGELTKN
jgi:predicted outer membrane repeat protein